MLSNAIQRSLLLTALACLAGCGGGSSDHGAPRDTATMGRRAEPPAEKPATPAPTAQTPATAVFRVMKFERGRIPKEYSYQGKLLGGARWIDLNGENTLLISQEFIRPEDKAVEGTKQQIYAYDYVAKEGTTTLLWKVQDAMENYCDQGEGLVSDIMVLDLDSNEVAESAFVYNIQGSCDVSPRTFKLMLHSGATKYALRGTNVVKAPETMGGEKKFDPAFDNAPKDFRQFAEEMWAKYVR